MGRTFKQKIQNYIFEQGPRRIFRSIFKKLFLVGILFELFVVFGTPFFFNDFNYTVGAGKAKFAALITDSSFIKEQLKPKTEKTYFGQMKKAPYSICYVHGFSASRKEVEPVISNVAKMLKANLFFTRLTGHGFENAEKLKTAKAQDWIKDTIECLEVAARTGDKAVLIGTSLGGALASLVAANTKYKIHSFILISPYFGIKDQKADLLAGFYGDKIAELYFKGYRSFEPKNEEQRKYWTTTYPAGVLKQLMIVNMAIRNLDFSRIKAPVFMAYSKQDEILDLNQVLTKYEQIVSQKRIDADPNYTSHVLAGDIVNPKGNAQLQKNIYSFIKANY
jgi:esterase/lipase